MRGDEAGILFTDTVVSQLQKLNPGVVNRSRAEDLAHRLSRALPNIQGNLDVWEHLRGIKTVFVDEENRERDVRFLDAYDLSANTFHVTDEFSFRPRPDAEAIRFDVAMLINGIPIIAYRDEVRAQAGRGCRGDGPGPPVSQSRPGSARVAPALRRYPHPRLQVRRHLEHVPQSALRLAGGGAGRLRGPREGVRGSCPHPARRLPTSSSSPDRGRADEVRPAAAPDASAEQGGRARQGPDEAPGPHLAHPGLGEDLHDDLCRQAAHRRSRSPEPHGAHARRPERAGGADGGQPGGPRLSRCPDRRIEGRSATAPRRRLARPDRLDDPQVRRDARRHLHPRERLRTGRRGAPHDGGDAGQLPHGRVAERDLRRLHGHAHRPHRPRQGDLQDLRRRRRDRVTSTSTRSASRSRTGRRCRSTTRSPRTTSSWTGRRWRASSWGSPS